MVRKIATQVVRRFKKNIWVKRRFICLLSPVLFEDLLYISTFETKISKYIQPKCWQYNTIKDLRHHKTSNVDDNKKETIDYQF